MRKQLNRISLIWHKARSLGNLVRKRGYSFKLCGIRGGTRAKIGCGKLRAFNLGKYFFSWTRVLSEVIVNETHCIICEASFLTSADGNRFICGLFRNIACRCRIYMSGIGFRFLESRQNCRNKRIFYLQLRNNYLFLSWNIWNSSINNNNKKSQFQNWG